MIFLDIDGVLADTVGALARMHYADPDLRTWWPRGEYSCAKAFGCTDAEVWAFTDHDWWASLPMLPHARALIDLCASRPGGFTLATSPLHDPASASGKVEWIRKHFGAGFRDYMIGPHKHLMARHPDAVLIDDFEANCQKFVEHGGCAILFPALWNRLHDRDPMHTVQTMLMLRDGAYPVPCNHYTRVVICGGPRTGKTTFAATFGLPVRHTDDVMHLGWSEASEAVSHWFDDPGPWVIEGVAAVRALRKWLERNPENGNAGRLGAPCAALYMRTHAWESLKPGQASMAKGIWTVFEGIRYALEVERGVVIEVIT